MTRSVPGVDTGSIHNTGTNSLQGYGGIRIKVPGRRRAQRHPAARLRPDRRTAPTAFSSQDGGPDRRRRGQALAAVRPAESWARFLDSFTNTTSAPVTIEVAFGGQLGYNTGTNQSAIASTSSGDTAITPRGRLGVVLHAVGRRRLGDRQRHEGDRPGRRLDRMGNFLRDPFTNALPASGDEANHPGFVYTLTIPAGETRSLAHFVVTGLSETRTPAGGGTVPAAGHAGGRGPDQGRRARRRAAAQRPLAGRGLLARQLDASPSAAARAAPALGRRSRATRRSARRRSSPYNVVGKSITQLKADMASGTTSAQQIMRAYLDRIAAYDQGPLGLHSVITVAPDAMAQAKAADDARAAGDTRPLLGIPILAKDIFDTKDMPTTGGSLVFAGYRPTKDAWQVAKLREAGAIIMGKANLAEFATDGHFSPSASGQVWNAFDPSRSSIGSSGGSAVAVASSFAAAALGTQTGDSLWGPSSAASLVSLRGTDGMQSTDGVMPLTYVQDYAGVDQPHAAGPRAAAQRDRRSTARATRSTTSPTATGRRTGPPALNADALQGKVIGVPASAFNDPFGTTGHERRDARAVRALRGGGRDGQADHRPAGRPGGDAGRPRLRGLAPVGACAPRQPVHRRAVQIIRSPLRLPQFRNTNPYTGTGAMTPEQVAGFQAARGTTGRCSAAWMDAQGVDAVVFPGQLSRHPPQRLDPAELRPARPAGLVGGRPERDLPGRRQRPRPADQPAAAGQGVRRPQAARLRLRVRGQGQRPRRARRAPVLPFATSTPGTVGGTVPATLSLTLGAPATFGAFTPGVAKEYTATTSANVISHRG